MTICGLATATACALAAWGMEVKTPTPQEPVVPVVLASHTPELPERFRKTFVESAVQTVRPPKDLLYVPCKDGQLRCIKRATLAAHTDWGDRPQTLPPVTVNPPRVRSTAARNKGRGTGSSAGVNKSIPAQIAEQLMRRGVLMGAQNLGGMAGFAAGGPIGGIAGSWAGCTVVTYGFLHADFAQKERWDLHPEKASGNWWWSTKMCSPLGFAFRSMEEREPYRKITALMGGLVWVPDPWVNLVGQLAPAAPAVTDNLKFIATALPSAPKSGRYSWQSTPYHTAGWAATTP